MIGPSPGTLASPFSKSCTGDEAAAAPEGQVGPEPCSQNSDAVAHTYQKSNMGRAPKPPCRCAAHPNCAEVRDRCLPSNRGKASIMAIAERRRRAMAGESSPDCSGCVGAALLRSRRKAGRRHATPSIARGHVADDENFGPAGHSQIRPHPYATGTIGLNTEPGPHRMHAWGGRGSFLATQVISGADGLQYSPRVTAGSLRFLIQRGEPQSSSASRFTAGALGFLTFTQCAVRPDR